MNLINDLLDSLDCTAKVKDIRVGLFHSGVETRGCGLAATLPRDVLRQKPPMVKGPGFLLEKSAAELAQMAFSDSLAEAAIGMATINSLLMVDEAKCRELNAREIIAEKGKGKNIAIIGHFPFVPYLRELAENLWVIEKNPQEDDLPEEAMEQYLPQADVVALTGTSITNHTIDGLLEACKSGAYKVMLGDTTPLSPVLFGYGIDAVCGTLVRDTALALRCVSQGANYRQIKGVAQLTMLKE